MDTARLARIVAITGCAWVIISAIPHVALTYAANPGDIGLLTDYDGLIRKDETDNKLTSQKVDFRKLSFPERYVTTPARPPVAKNVKHDIPIVRRTASVSITTGDFFENVLSARIDLTLRVVATAILICLAALALTRTPNRANFGLFAFCVGANPVALNARLSQFPSATAWFIYAMIIDFLFSVAMLGIVDYAVHGPFRAAFARIWDRVIAFIVIPFCALTMWPDFATIRLGIPSELLNRLGYASDVLFAVYGAAAMLYMATQTLSTLRLAAIMRAIIYTVGLGGYVFINIVMFTSIREPFSTRVNDAVESLSFFLFALIVGASAIDRLAGWVVAKRRLLIGCAVDTIFGVAWDPLTKAIQAAQHRSNLTISDGILGVVMIVTGTILVKPIDDLVAAQLTARDRSARAMLETARKHLHECADLDELDRRLVLIGDFLDLTCSFVSRRVGSAYRKVAALRWGGTDEGIVVDAIVAGLGSGVPLQLTKDLIRATVTPPVTCAFPIMSRSLIGFVATGDRRDGRALDDDDRAAVLLYTSHAAAVYIEIETQARLHPPTGSS